MKTTPCSSLPRPGAGKRFRFFLAIAALVGLAAGPLPAGTSTWTGGGENSRWQTPANWDTPPLAGDLLNFTGASRLANTNNFTPGTAFGGITFSSPAGGFVLSGNSVLLGGGITNRQVVTLQTINLPLALTVTSIINVTNTGLLEIGGNISGAFGLTKAGGGTLTLRGANTFSGPLTVNNGTVVITNDLNTGAVPSAPAPGTIVLVDGALRTPANVTLNPNRGIALGPVGGAGTGTLNVPSGFTLTYRGIIANNTSATGGLAKSGFGTLIVSGTNTYTGATTIRNGLLTLDFTQATSPLNHVIHPGSALVIGGETAGIGQVNNSTLFMQGRAGVTNSQSFQSTLIDIGGQVIRATNNGAGSAAILSLGPLTHNVGGVVTVVTPLLHDGGTVTTTATNVNGILGGWATISSGALNSSITLATNLAAVDGSGNIVNYSNYYVYAGLPLQGTVTGQTNLLIDTVSHPGGLAIAITNDANGAGSTVDVNTITFWNTVAGDTLIVGTNNTLRFGRFGGILKANLANVLWYIGGSGGTQTGGGTPGSQNIGTITAGGADNTPGELVFTINSSSQTGGGPNVETLIADNGTGAVTVVKAGVAPLNLKGHNTYSGGTYVTQGRVQLNGADVGTANPDGFGFGPVYIFPGGQFFGGGSVSDICANDFFIAGNGTSAEAFGAIRTQDSTVGSADPARFSGTITLIGDARLGGGATNDPSLLFGRITGPFSLEIGSTGNTTARKNGYALYNQSNDWTGDFTILATSTAIAGGHAVNTRVVLGTNDVIPDGFGKGNVFMSANFLGAAPFRVLATLDLNGFNETVNGLSTTGVGQTNAWIHNGANGSTATLTVGNNDQTAQFDGVLLDAPAWFVPGGVTALTKIGAGIQTLGSANLYSGDTLINGGTLALSGSGSISNSLNVRVNSGATFDVTGLTNGGFATPNAVRLDGGTLAGNSSSGGIGSLSLTNSQITLIIDPAVTNLVAGALNTGGATNRVNINAVLGISSYPTQFTIIKYTAQSGDMNIGFGSIPSLSTQGYFSNDTAGLRIVLVLTNGPKPLKWVGDLSRAWDVNTTANWLGFGAQSVFNTADSLTFDDSAATNLIDVTTNVVPAAMTFSNAAKNYTFFGAGSISGFGGLVKQGAGSVTFMNTGGDGYRGGVAVNAGSVTFAADHTIAGGATIASGATLQVGTNGGTGSLPTGSVINDGDLVFNRGASLVVPNVIAGSSGGSLRKTDAAVLTLAGANTFTGIVSVAAGTLQVGNASALGRIDNGTVISNGATLDVNGFNLGTEPVTVAGDGVGGGGAIVNHGAQQVNALRTVTLAADTVFGGTARWDIRDNPAGSVNATLSGLGFKLTKVGTNQVALVGVSGASTLGDIIVKEGTLGVETGTDLGTGSLTVSNGATLQFFNNSVVFNRSVSVQGNGSIPSLSINSGSVNIANSIALSGTVVFSGNGTAIRASGGLTGSAALIKTGTSRLNAGAASYTGSTTVSNGTVIFSGGKSGGSGITVAAGGALGGDSGGSISENVTVNGGGLVPGNPDGVAQSVMTVAGNVTLNSSTNLFELSPNPVSGNDQLVVFNDLTLTGLNTFRISVTDHLVVGDVYTLISYFGTGNNVTTNSIQIVPPTFGYEFTLVDPATTPGEVRIQVLVAIGFDSWLGNHPINPTLWDNGITANWLKAGVSSVFTNGDFANFSDFVPGFVGSSTNIILGQQLITSGLVFSNSTAAPFNFVGPGGLSGGGMVLEGEGAVTMANAGTNNWTGGGLIDFNAAVFFNPATLIVGDGSTNGNLGGGTLTNRGHLVFNRAGSLTISNVITDAGVISNVGPGVVTLNQNSTFSGEVHVLNGTLAAGASTTATTSGPLGSSAGSTFVTNSATLDVNGNDVGAEMVIVSGAGVGGQGAIINSGPSQVNALQFVTLAGDTTFGGPGPNSLNETNRWDIRGNAWLITTPPNSPYNLTKVGGNQVSLVNVTNIDPMIGDIDIQEGVFAIQLATAALGDPAATITIHSNAMLNVWSLSAAPIAKQVVLKNGGVYWSDNGTTTNIGPVVFEGGNATILNDGGTTLRFESNTISGAGNLVKIGGGTTILSVTNTYTGSTVISNGTLALLGDTSLAGSPLIHLAASNTTPILDVSGRTDATLTIGSGRTLKGAGIVRGALVVNAGGTIGGSEGQGALSVTNSATLSGLTVRELNAALVSGDLLAATNTITYGGTLTVSNVNGTLAAGQSYQLFRAGSYAGAFTTVNLPPLSSPLYWTNTLAVDGRIAVATDFVPQPAITSIELVGGNVVIRGTNHNGATPGPVYVLTSTNLLLPLSNWTVLATNAFDGSGSLNYTNGAPAGGERFYILQIP